MDPNPTTVQAIEFRDLGRIRYGPALELQRQLHEQVLRRDRPPIVLLLEHEPVITVTPREAAAGHVLASEAMLNAAGVERCETDRGGDVTYHGPGQLVVYPILPLEDFGLNIRLYIRLLEQAIIDTTAAFGVESRRDPAGVGVWVERPSPSKGEGAGAELAKIAAIGVRIRRWVSMHGLALNVTTNLEHFRLIVPCGLTRPVTSLQRELGPTCPDMTQVKAAMIDAIRRRLADPRI